MTDAPSTDLARIPEDVAARLQPVSTATIGDAEFERLWRIGLNLAKSGMFKDVTQGEQAFAKILLGRDLGLSPAQSLGAIYFVQGNLQIAATTLASFVRRHDGYDYTIRDHDAQHCAIEFWGERNIVDGGRTLLGVSEFSIEDAKAAGIYRGGPWQQHPRNMVFARAMSNGVRWFCPDLLGGVPVYTEGDTFDRTEDLTAGMDDDAPVTLHPDVEGIVDRARALGHAGLSNAQAAAVATNGQPDAAREAWVVAAEGVLDPMEAAQTPPEAEVVEPPDLATRLAAVEEEITQAEAAGDDVALGELVAERDLLRQELEAANDENQGRLV